MSVTEKLEQSRETANALRKKNGALAQRLDDMKLYFEAKFADAFSNVSLATDDIGGGLAGIAIYRGVSALYGWLATPAQGKPPGFMRKHAWLSDAAQAVLSGGAYAANLAIGRTDGEQLGPWRSFFRKTTSMTMLMSLDSLARQGYGALKAYSAKKALEENGGG